MDKEIETTKKTIDYITADFKANSMEQCLNRVNDWKTNKPNVRYYVTAFITKNGAFNELTFDRIKNKYSISFYYYKNNDYENLRYHSFKIDI